MLLRRFAVAALLLGGLALVPVLVHAQPDNFGLNQLGTINLGQQPLVETIGKFVNIILGFLGIVAFVIILYGGFLWMTSKGDEKQVGKAKRVIIDGVIGLAIVLASWAIAAFVMNFLGRGTGLIGDGGEEGPGGGGLPPAARYLVVTDFYPDPVEDVNAARNSVVVVTFNRALNCATVTPESVVLYNGAAEVPNVHLRCSGRSITIRSGTPCPAPLDQFPVPSAAPNACGSATPLAQCLRPDATASSPQCQPAAPPLASISQCPGLRTCGCFVNGSYHVLLKSGSSGDHVEGSGKYLQHDTTLNFTLGASLDTVAPRIASVDPIATPSQTVPRNRNVTVTFTRPVDPTSITVYSATPTEANQVNDAALATVLFRNGGTPVSGRIVGLTTRSIRWRPTDACGGSAPASCGCMPNNATITVEIHDGVAGIHGASCLGLDTSSADAPGLTCAANDKCSYTFSTSNDVDLTAPQLDTAGVYPSTNSSDVDRALNVGNTVWPNRVVAAFSEDIAADSVDDTTFLMANDVPTLNVGQRSSRQYGLLPGTEVLAPNRTYLPSLYGWGGLCSDEVGGVQDVSGNALAGRARWQFRTGESVNGGQPLITHISPNTGPHGQCVTILGYNLGCFNGAGDGAARTGQWTGAACQSVSGSDVGKIEISNGASLTPVPDSDIISWDEVDRPENCTPGVNCPNSCQTSTCATSGAGACGSCALVPNPAANSCQCGLSPSYSTKNQILITVPSSAGNPNPSTPADVVVSPAYNAP